MIMNDLRPRSPIQLESIRSAILALAAPREREQAMEEGRRTARRLAANAGSYGFPRASLTAREIELALQSMQQGKEVRLEGLTALVEELPNALTQLPQARIGRNGSESDPIHRLLLVSDDVELTRRLSAVAPQRRIHIQPPATTTAALGILVTKNLLQCISKEMGRPGLAMEPAALHKLAQYQWPGNIRELKNTLERAVLMSDGLTLTAERVDFGSAPDVGPASPGCPGTLESVERAHIEATLKAAHGNISQAAQRLGISRGTLYAKVKQYSFTSCAESAASD